MLDHISKFIPWETAKQKKQKFLDKLKGTLVVRVRKNVPSGGLFVVMNAGTGCMDSFCYLDNNNWMCWGTTPYPDLDDDVTRTFTNRQLEVYLTKLVQEASKESEIKVLDESCCLTWTTPK